MTPAQHQFDLDLAANMTAMSQWVRPRSSKIADTLQLGAERIIALTNSQPVDPPVQQFQPASTPASNR